MPLVRRLSIVALGACLLGGLWLALTPHLGPTPPPGPWDKVEHLTGFYILTVVALAAFPGSARWKFWSG